MRRSKPSSATTDRISTASGRDRDQRVLVVDDHPAARTGVCEILKAEGFSTIDCASADEALSILRGKPRKPIAVALLDLQLPDMDGIRLLEQVRNHAPNLPVIIYTGEGRYESVRQALNLGAFAYLEKAENPQHLVAKVREALRPAGTPSARQHSGKRTREGRAALDRITDAIPGAVYRYQLRPSGEQRFLYTSRGIEKLFGMTSEETQKNFARVWSLAHPDDIDSLLQSIHESAQTLKPWSHEFRVIIGGQIKWLRGSSIPEPRFQDGSIVWNGIFVDITDQKAAENAFRFTGFAMDRAADCIYWMTPDAKFFYVNDAACESLGYSREELLSMSVHDIDPEYPAETWPAFWMKLSFEGSITLRSRLRRKDGEVFPVEIKTNYLKFEGKEFNCSIVRDLSERSRTDEALRARVAQQATVSALGQIALSGVELPELLQEATRRVAQTLDVELCKVLELNSARGVLLLVAGVGWDDGYVGNALVPVDRGSQAGYTLGAKEPVVVAEFEREQRFSKPALLKEHGVESGMSAPINCSECPYGVLGVHSRLPRVFSEDDAHFLQSVANVIGTAVSRERSRVALEDKTSQLQAITASMSTYLETQNWREGSAILVRNALRLTGSQYGFVGTVVEGPVLRILAHEGVQWDTTVNRSFYEEAVRRYEELGYLEFKNFTNLFGHVITSGDPVISNNPAEDSRSGGLPAGHPPLNNFLGVPIRRGTTVVGIIGVANRVGGYSAAEETNIVILANAAGVLYENYRQRERESSLDAARRRTEDELRQAQLRLLEQQRCEKVQVEQELEKARESLVRQTQLAALGQLVGSMAHEMRNPLAVIRNASHLLRRRVSPTDAGAEEYLNMIEGEVDASNRMIQDLQALSRGRVLEKEMLDLGRQIDEATRRARVPPTVTCRVVSQPDPFEIFADPGQLCQVFVNLLSNACQAMRHRGELIVTANRVGGWNVLTVSDTGPGIPEDHRLKIFEPLFTTKPNGFGLGLTICRHIVDHHGGSINLLGSSRGGAVFEIRLPHSSTVW